MIASYIGVILTTEIVVKYRNKHGLWKEEHN